jgi:hypothetical protein
MQEALAQIAPVARMSAAFRGLKAYSEDDAAIFFGRDHEIQELYQLIKANTVTLVFGKSGTGKTSLLNAGVFPKLRMDDCLPFRIRLEFQENSPMLMEQIVQVILTQVDKYGFKIAPPEPHETLWAFFHKENLWRIVTPVLVFDQFEEIFTLANKYPSKKKEVETILEELADLAENQIPDQLRERYLREHRKIEFDYRAPKAKIVIAFREDFLPEMESLAKDIPSVKNSRFRLRPMNGTQAFDVITKTWNKTIDKAEAKKIVYYLTNETESDNLETENGYGKFDTLEIEPSLLSQVCAYLDKERAAEHLDKISADFLDRYPKGTILSAIYHTALRQAQSGPKGDQPAPLQVFIEDKLITEEGFRTKYDTAELEEAIVPGITALKQRYFIRQEGKCIELTHDVIATIIKSDRDRRRRTCAVAEANARAKRRSFRIIGAAVAIALIAWAASAILSKMQIDDAAQQVASARDTLNRLIQVRDSIRNSPIPQRVRTDDKAANGKGRDSLSRIIMALQAAMANESMRFAEFRREADRKLALAQNAADNERLLIKDHLSKISSEYQSKRDFLRMYESHVDSIIRFRHQNDTLQYHIGVIALHHPAFINILNK